MTKICVTVFIAINRITAEKSTDRTLLDTYKTFPLSVHCIDTHVKMLAWKILFKILMSGWFLEIKICLHELSMNYIWYFIVIDQWDCLTFYFVE